MGSVLIERFLILHRLRKAQMEARFGTRNGNALLRVFVESFCKVLGLSNLLSLKKKMRWRVMSYDKRLRSDSTVRRKKGFESKFALVPLCLPPHLEVNADLFSLRFEYPQPVLLFL